MSLFQYVSYYNDRLVTHRFVLEMPVAGIAFIVRDGIFLRMTAGGGFACCWLY